MVGEGGGGEVGGRGGVMEERGEKLTAVGLTGQYVRSTETRAKIYFRTLGGLHVYVRTYVRKSFFFFTPYGYRKYVE